MSALLQTRSLMLTLIVCFNMDILYSGQPVLCYTGIKIQYASSLSSSLVFTTEINCVPDIANK